jgi:hypothetical protein
VQPVTHCKWCGFQSLRLGICTAENLVVAVASFGNVLDTQQIQKRSFIIFFSVAQYPNSVLGCPMNKVYGSHAVRHTHLVEFL